MQKKPSSKSEMQPESKPGDDNGKEWQLGWKPENTRIIARIGTWNSAALTMIIDRQPAQSGEKILPRAKNTAVSCLGGETCKPQEHQQPQPGLIHQGKLLSRCDYDEQAFWTRHWLIGMKKRPCRTTTTKTTTSATGIPTAFPVQRSTGA